MTGFLLSLTLLIQTPAALQAQLGTVTGILRTNQGALIANTRVAITPADGTDVGTVLQGLTQTDSNGRYRLEGILPGSYRIMTGPLGNPQYHPGVSDADRATTILVRAGSITQVPDMVFWRYKVSGRVVDAATGRGRHIESLSIWCECSAAPLSAPGVNSATYGSLTAQVNNDGTFEFPSVPAGNQYLQVIDPGVVSFARPITVGDADIAGLEIKVSSETALRGTLLDRTGHPVTAVSISLKPKTSNDAFEIKALAPGVGFTIVTSISIAGPDFTKPSVTDVRTRLMAITKPRVISVGPSGSFAFSGVLPGTYMLEVNAPGGNFTQREVEVGLQGANVRIEVPFTQLSGRIVLDGGGTLPPVKGSVRIFGTAPGARVLYSLPDAEGRFYALLDPGEYRVVADNLMPDHNVQSISDGSRDLLVQPFLFDENSSREIQITIER